MENIRIISLDKEDISQSSEAYIGFKKMILDCRTMYPAIESWLESKVLPNIGSGNRSAFIAFDGPDPIASAVIKKGEEAKLCHLRILESHQDQHLGDLFFILMAVDIRHEAREVHFTLPQSLWDEKSAFFESFGFRKTLRAGKQYRKEDPELFCRAPFEVFWQTAMRKIMNLPSQQGILASTISGIDKLAPSCYGVPVFIDGVSLAGRPCESKRLAATEPPAQDTPYSFQ